MNKFVTIAAAAAFATLAACAPEASAPAPEATETVANEVELNEDGSVAVGGGGNRDNAAVQAK